MSQVEQYMQLLAIAMNIGHGLVDAIRGHAKLNMTPAEWDELERKWQGLVDRTAPGYVPQLPG